MKTLNQRRHQLSVSVIPSLRRKDEEKYGEYRTKRMVLEAFESLRALTK
jgi:hypothetical protein